MQAKFLSKLLIGNTLFCSLSFSNLCYSYVDTLNPQGNKPLLTASPAVGEPVLVLKNPALIYELQKIRNLAHKQDDFALFLYEIYGHDISAHSVEVLRKIFTTENWNQFPKAVVSNRLPGAAQAAYSADTNTIYLSSQADHAAPMLEELGHWIDSQLRPNGGDAVGDEGELFRRTVMANANLDASLVMQTKRQFSTLLAEDDHATLTDGTAVELMLCGTKRTRKTVNYAELEDAFIAAGCFDDDDDNLAGPPKKQQKIKGANVNKYAETLRTNINKGNYPGAKVVNYTGSLEDRVDTGLAANPPELILDLPPATNGTKRAAALKFNSSGNSTIKEHLEALAEQWEGAKNVNQRSEVLGEAVTTQAILERYPNNAELVWGFNSKSSTGIDQTWKINEGSGKVSYLFAEAKGGSSGLASDLDNNGLFDQMGNDWIVDRLVRERSPGTEVLAQQVMSDLGIKYQGYGFFKKEASGNWVVNGKENYVLSYRSDTTQGIKAVVVREKFSNKQTFKYDTGFHSSQAPKDLPFAPKSWVTRVHIPDHAMGSTHQMLVDTSPKYKSLFDTVLAQGDITVEFTVGVNPNDRVSLWNPETRTIHINKSDISKPGVASKLAGELALEMANASKDVEYRAVYDNVKNGTINNAEAYAKAIMEIEHDVVTNDFVTIESELEAEGLFKPTSALRTKNPFNQLDAGSDFNTWFEAQKVPRADGKPSLVELYKQQFSAVKSGSLSSHLIRKPATTIAADLQEIRTPALSDPETIAMETQAMDDAYNRATSYYNEFLTAVQQNRWEDAEKLRRQGDYLYSQHTATLEVLTNSPGIDNGLLQTYQNQNTNLQHSVKQLYRDRIAALAEERVTQAAVAHQEVETLMEQAATARDNQHFDIAEQRYDLAVQTQAKHEALLKTADHLAAEIVSAKNAGILDSSFPIDSDFNWQPIEGFGDFDNTSGARPTFLNEAINTARSTRGQVNDALFTSFNNEILLVQEQIQNLGNLSEADRVARVTESLQILHEAQRVTHLLEGTAGASEPSISQHLSNLENAINGLESSLSSAGVEFGDAVTSEVNTQFTTAAQTDSKLAGLLGEGGKVHTAFRYGGKLLMVVGVVSDGLRIIQADDTLGAAVQVAGGWAGAAGGAAAAEEVVAPIASWFGPIGWVVDGVAGLVGGGAGYWAGSSAASAAYSELSPHHDVDDPLTSIDNVLSAEASLIQPFDFGPFPVISTVAIYNSNTLIEATDSSGVRGGDRGEIRVSLVDRDGNPVPNVPVKFVAITGRSRLLTPTGKTNANGRFISKVEDSYAETVSFSALFDNIGDGIPNTPVVNGTAEVTFAVGG